MSPLWNIYFFWLFCQAFCILATASALLTNTISPLALLYSFLSTLLWQALKGRINIGKCTIGDADIVGRVACYNYIYYMFSELFSLSVQCWTAYHS